MPMAFNPRTGKLYLAMLEEKSIYQLNKDLPAYKAGERYIGAEYTTADRKPGDAWGFWGAIDPLTAKPAWRVPLVEFASWSGMLTTAGGLVFTGLPSGEFVALDEDTGKVLWKFQTGSGINAQPITYTLNGRQYVSVLSGLGGGASSKRGTAGKVQPGGSVWTFALMQD
jgi:alcohol dehydrogenase (cytochrome c)